MLFRSNISTNAARVDMETLTSEYLTLLRDKAKAIQSSISS